MFLYSQTMMSDFHNKQFYLRSRDHAVLWIEMIKALLKHPRENCLNAAWDAIRNTEKVLKWKVILWHRQQFSLSSLYL